MIQLLLSLSLIGTLPRPTNVARGPFTTCVWPNKCSGAAAVAQFRPCSWPNRCSSRSELALAPVQPCVWPNTCSAEAAI